MLHNIGRDLHHAARSLLHSPGFAAAAIVTIALGVGVNTGIFSVLNGLLFRDLPATDADELVSLRQMFEGVPDRQPSRLGEVSTAEYERYRDTTTMLSGVLAHGDPWRLTLGGENAQTTAGLLVSCNYFEVLDQRPALGRALQASDCVPGAEIAVMIGHELWSETFGADPSIVGRTLEVNRQLVTVVGVAPEGGYGGSYRAAFFGPISAQPLLAPFVLFPFLAWALPAVVMTAFGLILLMACANVANLLLARATVRAREIAVRLSLGASRARVVQQLLAESLLISLVGGVLGSVLALWSFQALVTTTTRTVDPGFRYDDVAYASFDLQGAGYDAAEAAVFWPRLLETARSLPGIDAAAYARLEPLPSQGSGAGIRLPSETNAQWRSAGRNDVSPDYFSVVGIPILRGRTFTDAELSDDARSVIVSEATAEEFWPDDEPLGKTLSFAMRPGQEAVALEVVGVAQDAQVTSLGQVDPRYIYLPAAPPFALGELDLLVRSRFDFPATAGRVARGRSLARRGPRRRREPARSEPRLVARPREHRDDARGLRRRCLRRRSVFREPRHARDRDPPRARRKPAGRVAPDRQANDTARRHRRRPRYRRRAPSIAHPFQRAIRRVDPMVTLRHD